MKENLKKGIKYLLMTALTVILLLLAFRAISWSDFIEGLSSCNWWWMALSMFTGYLAIVVRGLRWRMMLKPVNPSITNKECYDAYAACYLANLAFPRSGEVLRGGILASTGKISLQGALGNVVIERIWDLISTIIVALSLLFSKRLRGFVWNDLMLPIAGRLSTAMWILLALLCVACIVLVWMLVAGRLDSRGNGRFARFWNGLMAGVKAAFKMERYWLFLLYTVLIQLLYWAGSYTCALSFPPTSFMTPMDAMLVYVAGGIGWLVPVQGGFGAYHLIVSMTLIPIYHMEESTAMIFSTLSHESQVVVMIVAGAFAFAGIALSKRRRKRLEETVE